MYKKLEFPPVSSSLLQSNQYQQSIFHILYFSSHFQLEAKELIPPPQARMCFSSQICGTREGWLLTTGNRACTASRTASFTVFEGYEVVKCKKEYNHTRTVMLSLNE